MTEQNFPEKKKEVATVSSYLTKMGPEFQKALPSVGLTTERLTRVVMTAVRNAPKLGECDLMSLMGAVMQSAQLGLEPNTPLGYCYLIPYNNNKKHTVEAQFQMGYQGVIELAYRSDKYQVIHAFAVDKADKFDYTYGLDPSLTHIPAKVPSGEIVSYYAVYHLVNGGKDFRVMSKEQVMKHSEQYSQSWDKTKKEFRYGSAWKDHFDAMAKKTVISSLLKFAPKSIELKTALDSDNGILKTDKYANIDVNFEVAE